MRSIIRQAIQLQAPPDELFRTYMDSALHQAVTGAPVTIGGEPGTAFRAFDGMLSGTMLAVVSPSLVVQSWRSANFGAADPDSTLILSFQSHARGGCIELVHLDVPEVDFQGVSEGWEKFYWQPWREYLARR